MMISPDRDHEEAVSVSRSDEVVVIKTDDGRQISIDIGNYGQLRADFYAPDGPAGGDAELHVELDREDVRQTENY